jgi:hypothetical protein
MTNRTELTPIGEQYVIPGCERDTSRVKQASLWDVPTQQQQITEATRKALKLLNAYTTGHLDFWILAGPSKATCRAHIMSELEGKRVPQSKSGVTAMRDAFYTLAGQRAGDTSYRAEDAFRAWAKQYV